MNPLFMARFHGQGFTEVFQVNCKTVISDELDDNRRWNDILDLR